MSLIALKLRPPTRSPTHPQPQSYTFTVLHSCEKVTRSTRDRSISRSLQRWASMKSSIFYFITYQALRDLKCFDCFWIVCERVRIAQDTWYNVVNGVHILKLVSFYIPMYGVLYRGIVSVLNWVMYYRLSPLIQITSTNKVACSSTTTDLYIHWVLQRSDFTPLNRTNSLDEGTQTP